MKKVFSGTIVFLVIVFSFTCRNKELSSGQLMDAAWSLFKEGNFKKAIYVVNESILIDSSNEYAYLLKGISWKMLNDKRAAIDAYRKALKVNPKSPLANFSIGIDFWVNGSLDSSLVYYENALNGKLKPSINMYFDLTKNKFTRMEDWLVPSTYEIRHFRGLASYDMGLDANALIDFEYSLDGKYDIGESCYYLGKIYLERGRMDKACYYFTQAISVKHDIPYEIKTKIKNCLE